MGLSDLGGAVVWGEAKLLIEQAAGDGGTWLGAELAGWAYPATMPVLLGLVAQIGDERASRRVMPWSMKREHPRATPDEIAAADAALEDEIVFQ